MADEYIFTMYRLRRTHPPDKVVLDNVSLSFFPGAKIGVLGANGAGKSSLLRIMAGLDREFSGDAILAPGATVGLLPQEPDLDPSRDVRGNVEEGVAGSMALLRRFEEIGARLGEVEADEMEALLAEYQEVQDEIERRGAWTSSAPSTSPWTPSASRPATRMWPPSRGASAGGWRCAGCCWRRPTCCCWTSPPTTSTPSRWRGSSASWRSTRAPSWP